MRRILIVAIVAIVATAGACGGDVTDSTEYRALRDHRDSLAEEHDALSSELEQARSDLEDATAELDSATAEVNARSSEVDSLERQVADARAELDDLESVRTDLSIAESDLEEANTQLEQLEDVKESYEDVLTTALYNMFPLNSLEGSCITDGILESPAAADEFLDLYLIDATIESSEVAETFEACDLDYEEFRHLPGYSYGDDPTLDAFQDACQAGGGAACDDLYWRSAYGTDYNQVALTCGGRVPEPPFPEFCPDA